MQKSYQPRLTLQSFALTLFAGGLLFLTFSCHSGGSGSGSDHDSTLDAPATVLSNQINALHEQAMGEIAPLRTLEEHVRGKIREAAAKNADTLQLSRVAEMLNSSDTTMFGWMGQYDMELEGKSDSEKAIYLKAQLHQLNQIHASMDSAMQDAKALLQ